MTNVVKGGDAAGQSRRKQPPDAPLDTKTMTPVQDVKHQIRVFLDVDTVPVLWGDVGTGKTSIVQAMCREQGVEFINLDLTTISEQAMITGLPGLKYDEDVSRPVLVRVYEEQFEKLRQYAEAEARGEKPPPTCLFFDEVSAADDDLQAAVLNLFSHRQMGQWRLPSNCWMIGAGNTPEHSSHADNLHEAARNRVMHIDMPSIPWTDTRAWMEEQLAPGGDWHDKYPQEQRESIRDWAIVVEGFHMHHPNVYASEGNRDARDNTGGAFASPRAFTNMILALSRSDTGKDVTDPTAFRLRLAQACVGAPVAKTFTSYAAQIDLPDPRDWLTDPKQARAFTEQCAADGRHDKLAMVMQRMHAIISTMPTPFGLSTADAMQWRQDNAVKVGVALVEVGRVGYAKSMATSRFKTLMETDEFRNAPITDTRVQKVIQDATEVLGPRLLKHNTVVKAVLAEVKKQKQRPKR